MRCPQCRNKLLQKSGDVTRLRLDGVVEFDAASGKCKARCHWCRADVELPLELRESENTEHFTIPVRAR